MAESAPTMAAAAAPIQAKKFGAGKKGGKTSHTNHSRLASGIRGLARHAIGNVRGVKNNAPVGSKAIGLLEDCASHLIKQITEASQRTLDNKKITIGWINVESAIHMVVEDTRLAATMIKIGEVWINKATEEVKGVRRMKKGIHTGGKKSIFNPAGTTGSSSLSVGRVRTLMMQGKGKKERIAATAAVGLAGAVNQFLLIFIMGTSDSKMSRPEPRRLGINDFSELASSMFSSLLPSSMIARFGTNKNHKCRVGGKRCHKDAKTPSPCSPKPAKKRSRKAKKPACK